MSQYRRRALGDDFGYVPGEQPPDGGWLKLNTNECPLPPSARVADAVAEAAAGLSRYPPPSGEPLRSALAARHGVQPEQVLLGNGGDDLLSCCYRAYVEPGERVVRLDPSYSLFPVLTRMSGGVDVALPLGEGWRLPPRFASEPAVLRFVVQPNAPTGTCTSHDLLQQIVDTAEGVVVIDEAYADFAGDSCIGALRGSSWLVVRTFSKSHALAGLRVGYAVGDAQLIEDLRSVQDSYPVDRCAIAGALAALQDEAHHRLIVDTVLEQRARLTNALRQRGWDVPDSHANFVFAKPPQPSTAREVQQRLHEQQILVRHFNRSGIDDRLRITVGDAAAVDQLLAAM